MPEISKTVSTLRITGDNLVPETITEALKAQPTHVQEKGKKVIRNGNERIAQFGMWTLEAEDKTPGDEEAQIKEILCMLSDDLDVWKKITNEFRCELFFGLFMDHSNEGFSLSPELLSELGLRGIELALDIYAPSKKNKET